MSPAVERFVFELRDTFRSASKIERGAACCWKFGNGLEELLRRSGPVTLDIEAFTAEWKKVLGNVIEALRQAGYKKAESEEMNRLVKVWSSIRSEGILYSPDE